MTAKAKAPAPAAPAAPAKKYETLHVLYTGRSTSTSGKLGYKFLILDDEGRKTPRELFYTFKKKPSVWRVGVYTVKADEGDKTAEKGVYANTLTWAREWDDETEANALDLERKAVEKAHEALRLAKREATNDAVRKLCAPLAKVYRGLSVFERSAFLVLVLNEIEHGGGKWGRMTMAAKQDDDE